MEAAREAFEALNEQEQAQVENLAKLTAAEKAIEQLEQEQAESQKRVQSVMEMIEALPQTVTLKDKSAVEAAREAFEALNEQERAQVENLAKLTDAEKAIEELKTQTPGMPSGNSSSGGQEQGTAVQTGDSSHVAEAILWIAGCLCAVFVLSRYEWKKEEKYR